MSKRVELTLGSVLRNRFETLRQSDAVFAEVKRIRGKKLPLTAPGLATLRSEHARSIEPEAAQLEGGATLLSPSMSGVMKRKGTGVSLLLVSAKEGRHSCRPQCYGVMKRRGTGVSLLLVSAKEGRHSCRPQCPA